MHRGWGGGRARKKHFSVMVSLPFFSMFITYSCLFVGVLSSWLFADVLDTAVGNF